MRRFVLVCALLAAVGPAQAATSSPPSAGHDDVRAAASRALGLLVDASASWPDKRTCTSCHHQLLPALAFTLARDLDRFAPSAVVQPDWGGRVCGARRRMERASRAGRCESARVALDRSAARHQRPRVPGHRARLGPCRAALVALTWSGMPASDPAYERGLRFLLGAQGADGAWHVRTRLHEQDLVSPPYFETGFPHGKDQMISAMATAWAAMALMEALPAAVPAPPPLADPADWRIAGEPAWVAVAASGVTDALARALDAGLDPNARTAAGTSVVMVAMPDVDKIRLLLDRGADPNRAAESGMTPLMVAANFPGGTPAVDLLLARGALAERPSAAVNDSTAAAFAIWSGEVATLELVMARGGRLPAHVSIAGGLAFASPLDIAVWQRDEPMVRALVRHGADVNGLDEAGVPPLTEAVLFNDLGMARLLLSLGAKVNAMDQNGETTLLHAAQIDFGDTAMMELLVTSGADRSIRGPDQQSALDLARRYGHVGIARVLEGAGAPASSGR